MNTDKPIVSVHSTKSFSLRGKKQDSTPQLKVPNLPPTYKDNYPPLSPTEESSGQDLKNEINLSPRGETESMKKLIDKSVQTKITKLEEDKEELKKRLVEHEKKTDSYEEKLTLKNAENSQLKEDKEKYVSMVNLKNAENSKLKEERELLVSEHQNTIKNLEEQIKNLIIQKEAEEKQKLDIESKLETIEKELKMELKKKDEQLLQIVSTQDGEKGNLIAKLERDITNLEEAKNKMEGDIKNHSNKIKSLEEDKKNYGEEINKLIKDNTILKEEKVKTESNIQIVRKENEVLTKLVEDKEKLIRNKDGEIKILSGEKISNNKELEKLTKQNNELMEKKNELEKENSELKEKLKNSEAEYADTKTMLKKLDHENTIKNFVLGGVSLVVIFAGSYLYFKTRPSTN